MSSATTHSSRVTNKASALTLQLPTQAQRTPRKRRKTGTASGCFWPACGGQASLYSDDEAIVTCPPTLQSVKLVAFDGPAFEVARSSTRTDDAQTATATQPVPPSTSLRSLRAAHDARKGQSKAFSSSISNASSLASTNISPVTSSAYLTYASALPRSSTPPTSHHTAWISSSQHSQSASASVSSSSSHNLHLATPPVSSSSLAQDGHSHRQATATPSVIVEPTSPDRKRKREGRLFDVEDTSMLYIASLIDANAKEKHASSSLSTGPSASSVYSTASYVEPLSTVTTTSNTHDARLTVAGVQQNRLKVCASSQSFMSCSTSGTSLALSEVLNNFPSIMDGAYQSQRVNGASASASAAQDVGSVGKQFDSVLTTSRDTFGVSTSKALSKPSVHSSAPRKSLRNLEHSRQSSELLKCATTHTFAFAVAVGEQSVEVLQSDDDHNDAYTQQRHVTHTPTQSIDKAEAILSPRRAASHPPCPPPETPLPALPRLPASVALLATTPPRSHTRSRSARAGHLQSNSESFSPRTPEHASVVKQRATLGEAGNIDTRLFPSATPTTNKAALSASLPSIRPPLIRTKHHARGMSRFYDENVLPNSLTPPRRSSRRTSPQQSRDFQHGSLKRTQTVKRRPTLLSMRASELERNDSDATIKASSLPHYSTLGSQAGGSLNTLFGTTNSAQSIATMSTVHAPFEFEAQEEGMALAM